MLKRHTIGSFQLTPILGIDKAFSRENIENKELRAQDRILRNTNIKSWIENENMT